MEISEGTKEELNYIMGKIEDCRTGVEFAIKDYNHKIACLPDLESEVSSLARWVEKFNRLRDTTFDSFYNAMPTEALTEEGEYKGCVASFMEAWEGEIDLPDVEFTQPWEIDASGSLDEYRREALEKLVPEAVEVSDAQ